MQFFSSSWRNAMLNYFDMYTFLFRLFSKTSGFKLYTYVSLIWIFLVYLVGFRVQKLAYKMVIPLLNI